MFSWRHSDEPCVCLCYRDFVTLTLTLAAAGSVAMAALAEGRGGKLVGPSSRGGGG